MYKLFNKIQDVRDFDFLNNDVIAIDNSSRNFVIYNLDDFKKTNTIEGNYEKIVIIKNLILDSGLKGWDLSNNKKIALIDNHHYVVHNNDILISKVVDYAYRKVTYYLADIVDLFSAKKINFPAYPISIVNNQIVCRKDNLFVYDLSKHITLWQSNISDLCAYDSKEGKGLKKPEINNVLLDGDKVIVLAGLDVVAFAIDSGKQLWHTQVGTWQGVRAIINDGFLYTANADLNKINLETGAVIYQREFEYIYIHGEKTGSAIEDLVWHNNFIWTVMDTSPNALLVIDPKTGKYVEVIPLTDLGITSDCHAPVFHHNKMYLHGYNGTLYILEEENPSG